MNSGNTVALLKEAGLGKEHDHIGLKSIYYCMSILDDSAAHILFSSVQCRSVLQVLQVWVSKCRDESNFQALEPSLQPIL